MKTIAFCFAALFAGAFAAPILAENDPFGNSSWGNGDIENRIVGGSETSVHLQLERRWTYLRRISSHLRGSVPADYRIMAGSTTVAGDANAQLRILNLYLRYPQYEAVSLQNNIAIAYWKEPLTFGDTVQPIALPPQGTIPEYTKSCSMTGWGSTRRDGSLSEVLRSATAPLVSNEICNGPNMHNGTIYLDILCAGVPEGDRGIYTGDFGGPVVVNKVLFGVISWGYGCALPNYPSVFTRVPFFTNWIKKNL